MDTKSGFAPAGSPRDDRRDIATDSFADLGWDVLRIDAAPDAELAPLEVSFVLVHPGLGVALVDLAPARAREPVERLCQRLEAVNFPAAFPGYLPIVYRSLDIGDLWRLPLVLNPPFASKPPIGVKGAGWIALLQQALLVKSAPAVPVPPETAVPMAELQPEQVHEPEPEPEPELETEAEHEPEPEFETEPGLSSGPEPLLSLPLPEASPIQDSGPPSPPARRGLHPVWVFAVIALSAGVATLHEHGLSGIWGMVNFLVRPRDGTEQMTVPRPVQPTAAHATLPPSETILRGADAAWVSGTVDLAAVMPSPEVAIELWNGRIAPSENGAVPAGLPPLPSSLADPAEPVSVIPASDVRIIGAEAGQVSAEAAPPGLDASPLTDGAPDRIPAAEPGRLRIVVHHEVGSGATAAALVSPAIPLEAEVEFLAVATLPDGNPIVRYADPIDRPVAERLAESLGPGWAAQEFAQVAPGLGRGTLEVWLPASTAPVPRPNAASSVAVGQDAPHPELPEPVGTASPAPAETAGADPPSAAAAAPKPPNSDAATEARIEPPPQPDATRADPPDTGIPRPESPPAAAAPPTVTPNPPRAPPATEARPPAPDPRVVNMLITRGDEMMSRGDISGARLFYSRAAAAGSAAAATAMGRSFDPGVLAELGVRGIRPDREQASQWYRRAAELGQTR